MNAVAQMTDRWTAVILVFGLIVVSVVLFKLIRCKNLTINLNYKCKTNN